MTAWSWCSDSGRGRQGRGPALSFDLNKFTPPRTWTWALIAPAGRDIPGALCRAPAFKVTHDQLGRAVMAVALAEPRTTLIKTERNGTRLRFKARSRVLGLPDIITVHLLELADGGVSLAIYSRARYGLYDLGVNRNRVRRWLAKIESGLSR